MLQCSLGTVGYSTWSCERIYTLVHLSQLCICSVAVNADAFVIRRVTRHCAGKSPSTNAPVIARLDDACQVIVILFSAFLQKFRGHLDTDFMVPCVVRVPGTRPAAEHTRSVFPGPGARLQRLAREVHVLLQVRGHQELPPRGLDVLHGPCQHPRRRMQACASARLRPDLPILHMDMGHRQPGGLQQRECLLKGTVLAVLHEEEDVTLVLGHSS
mmetsp:Transcript_3799/g.6119  ORF Transcript_3799/g.6119 Transcript_3799/m.6119 type:complete len:214 (-) Transcript_3799:202-843(-)